MSFSSDTKKELCRCKTKPREMRKAEAYGLILFCKKFSSNEIFFRTESETAAKRFTEITAAVTGVKAEIKETVISGKNVKLYKAGIYDVEDCKRIEACFGHDAGEVSLRINRANIEFDICAEAFLRGAFLTCGNVSDPESEYHLEFNVGYKNLANDLCRIIQETSECVGERIIVPKIVSRRGAYVVYLKGSDDIADFLTLMGAGNASMTVMQVKIQKSCKNQRNRKANSKTANTEKTVSAAVKQIQAINDLEESGVLDMLSEELQETAKIRRNYPLASLNELCGYFSTPISRSSLNRRLNKLIALSGRG